MRPAVGDKLVQCHVGWAGIRVKMGYKLGQCHVGWAGYYYYYQLTSIITAFVFCFCQETCNTTSVYKWFVPTSM